MIYFKFILESIIYFSRAPQQIIYLTLYEPNIIYFKNTPAPPPWESNCGPLNCTRKHNKKIQIAIFHRLSVKLSTYIPPPLEAVSP